MHDDNGKRDPSFNIYEFKNWFSKQPEFNSQFPKKVAVQAASGQIESRLGLERLQRQIEAHNTEITHQQAVALSTAFKANGGMIVEGDDLNVKIQVVNGTFALPRLYTKVFGS